MNLDIPDVEPNPEQIHWVDDIHRGPWCRFSATRSAVSPPGRGGGATSRWVHAQIADTPAIPAHRRLGRARRRGAQPVCLGGHAALRDSGGGGTDCSAAVPCKITTAVQGAHAGDEVILNPGDYAMFDDIVDPAPITIHGVAGQPRPRLLFTGAQFVSLHTGSVLRYAEVDQTVPGAIWATGALLDQVIVRAPNYPLFIDSSTVRNSIVVATAPGGVAIRSNSNSISNSVLRNVTAIATNSGGVAVDAFAMTVFGEREHRREQRDRPRRPGRRQLQRPHRQCRRPRDDRDREFGVPRRDAATIRLERRLHLRSRQPRPRPDLRRSGDRQLSSGGRIADDQRGRRRLQERRARRGRRSARERYDGHRRRRIRRPRPAAGARAVGEARAAEAPIRLRRPPRRPRQPRSPA